MNDIEIMQELKLKISQLEEENKRLKRLIKVSLTTKSQVEWSDNITLQLSSQVKSDYLFKKIKSIIATNERYKFIYMHPRLWNFVTSSYDIVLKNDEQNPRGSLYLYGLKLDTLDKLKDDEILFSEFNLKEVNMFSSNHVYVRKFRVKQDD